MGLGGNKHRKFRSKERLHVLSIYPYCHCAKKPVTTMLTYLGNVQFYIVTTWKPLVLITRHFDYCPSASEGDNQSVGSSAPVVSRCFPGSYNVKLYISRGKLAWWLLAFFCAVCIVKLRRVFTCIAGDRRLSLQTIDLDASLLDMHSGIIPYIDVASLHYIFL